MTSAITAMPPLLTRIPSRLVLLGLLAIITAFALALVQAVSAERQVRRQAAETAAIVTQIQAALQTGIDAESSQRGFLLTGDVRYLDGYNAARDTWLAQLEELIAAFPEEEAAQRADTVELRRLATAKLREMGETFELAQSDQLRAAVEVVQSGRGKLIFDQFRRIALDLQRTESAILAAQIRETERIERATFVILALLTLMGVALIMLSLWLERRTSQAERRALDADEIRKAYERSDLLAREMEHRIKNLFAIIGAMISYTARSETELKPALDGLRGRINALSVAHSVGTGSMEHRFASIGDVARATLDPYQGRGRTIEIDGPVVDLPVKTVSPLGLILHELATNAIKYGALAGDGTVSVSWDREADEAITLLWQEKSAVVPPETAAAKEKTEGFGSMMLRQAAMQIDAEVERSFTPEGLRVQLRFQP